MHLPHRLRNRPIYLICVSCRYRSLRAIPRLRFRQLQQAQYFFPEPLYSAASAIPNRDILFLVSIVTLVAIVEGGDGSCAGVGVDDVSKVILKSVAVAHHAHGCP